MNHGMAPRRRLKVVDVTSFFSNSCGGIRRYYQEKAAAMPADEVESHFVVPGPVDAEEPFGNGTLHRLSGPPLRGNPAYHRFGGAAELARLLHRLSPDVIELGSHYFLPGLVKRAARDLPSRPRLVGFFHSHPEQVVQNVTARLPGNPARPLARPLWWFFARQHRTYDATLVASRHVESQLARWKVPNVFRVGLGVDVDTFRPPASPGPAGGEVMVTYAGRFTVDKELPLLVKAFERVAAPGFVLRFVGDGPFRPWLEARARHRPWMRVLPVISSADQMSRLLAESHMVVVPSRTETFSLTTAEALACGTPVLGPDRGAVAELVQESGCGMTFSAGDAGALATKAQAMLTLAPAQREDMARRGRLYITGQFTWRHVTERVLKVYEHALRVDPGGAWASADPHARATPA